MAAQRRKKRKHKFKAIKFKLSIKQMKSLENYCKARKTTPIKLIKMRIGEYIENFSKEVPLKYYSTINQLTMFDEDNEEDKTLDMFE